MGASQYKKKRVEDREAGVVTAAETAAQEKAKKDSKTRIITVAVVAVIVVMIALVSFVNSDLFSNGLAAVRVGDTEFTVAETRYAYELAYQQFYESYSSYITYFLDPSLPLDEQECTLETGITWKDYFMNVGMEYLRRTAALHNEAVKAGFTLSEDGYNAIDNEVGMLSFYASVYGYTLDSYLAANFGDGCDEALFRSMMERDYLVAEYSSDMASSFTYSMDELDAHYEANSENYDTVEYLSVYLPATANEESGITAEQAKADALAKAEAIMADCDGSVESFKEAVMKHAEKEASENSTAISSSGNNKEWYTAADRKIGDVTSIESDNSVTLYCFNGIDTHQYNTVDVRHLLIKVIDSDDSGDYSDEEKQIAKEQLEIIMKSWDGTEEGFIALAEEYSQDTGSNANGGLYERICKGEMVPEFDAFCFSGAKAGDTATVYGENSGYAGYHFIYFVGENLPFNRAIADDALRSEDYSAWESEILEPVTVEKTFMFRYV